MSILISHVYYRKFMNLKEWIKKELLDPHDNNNNYYSKYMYRM